MVSVVSQNKRKRSEEPEELPTAKQQKVAAVETIDVDTSATQLWDNLESDF